MAGILPPMRLVMVRHGETVGESSIRLHGRNDVALSDLGRQQAHRVGQQLAVLKLASCVHSPLRRARESAAIISGHHRTPLPLVEDPGLREIDFGELEGLTVAEARATSTDFAARWDRGEVLAYPGGDDVAEFRCRAGDAVERCVAAAAGRDLLLVAHRGIVVSALFRLIPDLGGSLRRFATDLGSWHALRRRDGRWQVEVWNEVPR
jgi:probable phosphoglycerate mutase